MTDVSLANIPRLMTNTMRWYEDPAGANKQKDQTNWVTARDDYDRRTIEYYRDSLDASYSTSSAAYTGAEGGFPAGDLNWFPARKADWESGVVPEDIVVPLVPYDGNASTFVNAQIIADTTANGGLSANRVYELQRGEYYLHNAIFTVPNGQTLRIRGAAGEGPKPVIYLWETGLGDTPTRPPGNFAVLNGGHIRLSDLCIVGYYEPEPARLDGVQGGLINTTGAGSSIILDEVVLSNISGQHVRTGQNTTKVQVTNSIFANMGALTTSNFGAGKGFDLREAACDSLIILNNTFVNYQDRPIRHYNFGNPGAGTGLIGYGRIEHNTFVNGMGFHGLLSLGNVGAQMIISNNLFADAFALGEDSTDATRAAEWANTGEIYPNGNNRITWIFTAPNEETNWTVNNNFYSISDSGWAFLNDFNFGVASPLSGHIKSRLGADSSDAFTMTDVSLANIPRLMTNTMRWYEDPAGANKQKDQTNWVTARDDYDRRTIEYYRDSLDASYSTSIAAYTGAEGGFPAGDLNWFPGMRANWESGQGPVSVRAKDRVVNDFILAQNYPNPFNPVTRIDFIIPKNGAVTLEVFNITGQKVETLIDQKLNAGYNFADWNATNFASGVYFYSLKFDGLTQTKKMILIK
jgi:hypothetical protein